MDLIDEFIRNDIEKTSEMKSIPWLRPIVHIRPREDNPFLSSDFASLNKNDSVINNEIGQLFCVPGCEMEIDFPEEIDQKTDFSPKNILQSTAKTLRGIAKTFNRSSIAHLQDINNTYSCTSGNSFLMNVGSSNDRGKTFMKNLPLELLNFAPSANLKMVEPIMLTLFLYSDTERKIISDYWNFIPPNSVPLFDSCNINTKSVLSATFLYDPKITDDDIFFVLLLSHPTSVDNSSSMIKYYTSPNVQNEQTAVKKLHNTFPRIFNCFSTFACTFSPFQRKGFNMPQPYLLENPLPEKDIHEFLSDAAKKYKQIPFTVSFKLSELSPFIIRPIYRIRIQPYLSPIHQLIVRLDTISFRLSQSHKTNNILISLSLLVNGGKKACCMPSKLAPMSFVSESFSRCVYHTRSPEFDELFLINLPQPLDSDAQLLFKVYHAHIKKGDKNLTVIGTAKFPLYENNHRLFIADGDHSAHIVIDGTSTPDKSSKIHFNTFLRSNLVTNDSKFLVFSNSKSRVLSILTRLSEQMVVNNLIFILNKILKAFAIEKDISFLPFVCVRDSSLKIVENYKFEKYLNIFVRYFAFRDFEPQRAIESERPISLHEKSFHTSNSLIEISKYSPENEVKSIGMTYTSTIMAADILKDPSDFNAKKNEMIPIHLKIINCFTRTIEANGLEYLDNLADFIFSLIVKALAMLSKVDYMKDFDIFVKTFAKAVRNDMKNVKKHSKSIGLFANLLFDIGLTSISAKVTHIYVKEFMSTSDTFIIVVQYINFAFRPALFFYSMKYIDGFKFTVIKLIEQAFCYELLYDVLSIILQLLSIYDGEMSIELASILIPCVKNIRPNQLPSTTEIMSHLAFLDFIFEYANADSLRIFVTENETRILFDLCHFILARATTKDFSYARSQFLIKKGSVHEMPSPKVPQVKVAPRQRRESTRRKRCDSPNPIPLIPPSESNTPTVNEMVMSTRQSLLSFATNFLMVSDLNGAFNLFTFLFHMLNDTGLETFQFINVLELLSTTIKKFSPGIFKSTQPCFVRLISLIFDLVLEGKDVECLIKPVFALFEADFQTTRTTDNADAFCVRSLSFLKYAQMKDDNFNIFMDRFEGQKITSHFYDTFCSLKGVAAHLADGKISAELRHDFVFYQFIVLNDSPDSQFEALRDLYDLHASFLNYPEMINISILQAALIIEVLTLSKRMPNYFGVEHPALLFQDECPLVSLIECNKMINIPSFADSPNFNEHNIIVILNRVGNLCLEAKLYEPAIGIIDFIWPLLEQRRLYEGLEKFFGSYEKIFTLAEKAPKVTLPFFKVSFFGVVFMKEDRKTFIYRGKPLENLFEFAESIVKKYQTFSQDSKIELISDSDIVDVNTLDPKKNYIQITYVEPYKPKSFDCTDKFFFDRPFVPGEKKKQGNLTNQWIARTICKTKYPLPSVVRRFIVESSITREYEPIINAYRQIRKRTDALKSALEEKDSRKIQQLLHGSLIVTVNEGPEKIAEAFMNSKEETKGKTKLRTEFIDLLKYLRIGVKYHDEWVTNNNEFVPLQVQLEEGLEDFVSKLGKVIGSSFLK